MRAYAISIRVENGERILTRVDIVLAGWIWYIYIYKNQDTQKISSIVLLFFVSALRPGYTRTYINI